MKSLAGIQRHFKRKMKDQCWIWLVLFFAASLRIINLISGKAFWDDELFSVLLARKPFWDFLYGAITDVHPPGHLTLLYLSHFLLGGADWVYRLPSVLTGCALVGLVYFLGREFFGKAPALLASLLVAISPYFIQLSNEARSYSLATLVITLMAYAFIKSFRTSEKIWYRFYTISGVLCAYVDHFTWIWLFMINVYLFLSGRFKKLFSSHLRILIYGFPALLLTIYQALYTSEKIATHVKRPFHYFSILKKFFAVLWHGATGYGYSGWSKESLAFYSTEPLFWLAITAYASFLMAIILAVLKAQKDVSLFVLFSSIAPMILLCVLYPTRLESRYVSFVMPPLFIFAAAGFRRLKYGLVGLLPVIFVSLYFTFKTLAMPWDPIHREDDRAAIDYVFKLANENDAVSGLVRPVEYYGPKEKSTRFYHHIEDISFQQRYKRIFLLEPPLYVDPAKDHTRLDNAQRFLARQGYELTESIDFGQNGVRTFVHRFELKS